MRQRSNRASSCCRNTSPRLHRLEHRLIVASALRADSERRALTCPSRPDPALIPALSSDRASDFFPQSDDIAQARAGWLPSASTRQSQSGMLDVDAGEAHAAALRVFDERGRMIKPHRLVVEQRRVERGRKMRLQIRAGIREQREAGRVRFGKSVQRKGRDRRDDLLGRVAGDAVSAPSPRAA